MLLNLSKIKKSFGTRVLFDDVSFEIGQQDKIGFVGVNGAGKTTLFKMLLGEEPADGGEVFRNRNLKIGYLQQHADLDSDKTVLEELLTVYEPLIALEQELADVALAITNGAEDSARLAERQHALHERFEREGGFTYRSVARSSLIGLGFTEQELTQPFASLSGGQKTRVYLCKVLLSGANLLFLDEPTNHLDIDAVQWLENFLRDYNGAFVVISHDRYFLDRISNKILELENRKITLYKGNYTTYQKQKEESRLATERQYENTQREIKRIEGIIAQQRQWNREKNIKTAENKQKMVDRLSATLEKPDETPAGIRFQFRTRPGGGDDVLICRGLGMAFDQKELFRGLDLHIVRGENVFLLGPNGCGKTTLFKILTGELEPLTGTHQIGASIDAAYYDQTQETLDFSKTVFDEVHDAYPEMTDTEVRNALACFLFRGDDVFKEIGTLSGGERAKVSLVKLMLSGANFLLLDEPTNHLDITSREALEDALAGYDGTLFIVSHDRYFINKLAERVLYMTKAGLENYLGNYDYFLEKHQPQEKGTVQKQAEPSGKLSYQEQKQEQARRRKLENQLRKAEEAIDSLETELAGVQASLAECGSDYVKAAELTQKAGELEEELERQLAEWEKLESMGGE